VGVRGEDGTCDTGDVRRKHFSRRKSRSARMRPTLLISTVQVRFGAIISLLFCNRKTCTLMIDMGKYLFSSSISSIYFYFLKTQMRSYGLRNRINNNCKKRNNLISGDALGDTDNKYSTTRIIQK
jgi:hypothetical protein